MLAHFIVEKMEVHPQGDEDEMWVLERAQGGGVGMLLRTPEGSTITQAMKRSF